jgi:ferredoxin-NADP reductase
MMSSSSGLVAGILFVCLAAVNVVLILEASRAATGQKARRRLLLAHRLGGYSFVILLSIMAYFMSQRLMGAGLGKKLPTYIVVHVALVLLLVPVVFLKVLIARRYKQSHSLLMPLGLTIFATSFVVVAIPAFSEFLSSANEGSLGLKLTVVAVVGLCLLMFGLTWRSRKKGAGVGTLTSPGFLATTVQSTELAGGIARGPMNLVLERIEQETHDTKTLRFLVPRERWFQARPGQFLTFHWFIDGKRVLRSYTISSSPTHSAYVEITPKRVENGCVSNFLHDRAKLGLAVEATGPHGQFYFDESIHRDIVLIAAGSGITPMISILRYIHERCPSTPVTLLYFVRTSKDIIFETQLEKLRDSCPNFDYWVSLSQPDETWKGHTGRLTREFIVDHVIDLDTPVFFLCGPTGFMENSHRILASLGVEKSRITQESFGERRAPTKQGSGPAVGTVHFVHSQKTCDLHAGSSLLEVAESNGVQIPYSCRQGQCGTCATRVLRGSVHMSTDVGLTTEQKDAGYVLPCVSRAEGSVIVAA